MVFETLKVSKEGAVLFVEIAAPPINLLGPELGQRFLGSNHITQPRRAYMTMCE